MPAAPTLAVLHGLRLGSVVRVDDLARRTGLPSGEVSAQLAAALERGWVRHHEGRLPGWSLTRSGREEGERLLAEELDAAGAREAVAAVHAEFVPLNARVLEVCTAWQVVVRDGVEVPNDHRDEAYDAAVLERLAALHASARPLLRRLSAARERFRGCDPRLEAAHKRTLAGDVEWFTRPTIDSYHTVWFELHEDLLATLGLRREGERSATAVVRGARAASPTDRAAGRLDGTHQELA